VPYRANIFALKQLGVTHILASGAVGSLCEKMAPRELVIVDQVIDKTFRRASTFFESGIAVHTELSAPFCPVLRERLLAQQAAVNVRVHDGGTYVCMEGPQFSSRAESHMHQGWGGHLIGMTCLPEAKLAREAEIAYALVALVTDYDSWRPHDPSLDQAALLAEIISHLHEATANAIALIRATVESLSKVPPGPSPAHDALRLAIWSDKTRVDPALIERLRPILGRYFSEAPQK
jgi:5'-methylthioadenosine phosphorylase